jgi:transcriptional regulator GlxA family with amidase domain
MNAADNKKIKTMNVAILVYDHVELVDMNGPVDVFLHANDYNGNRYTVYTVAEKKGAIISEGNVVTIVPQYTIDNCPDPDVIVIPGLITKTWEASDAIVAWLKKMGTQKKGAGKRNIMSVCVGCFTLAKTGLLKGLNATTHFLSIADIQKKYPGTHFIKNVRFVEDGNFVTTGGITSGIDGALHLVEKFDNAVVAQQTADIMVYNRESPLPVYTLLPPYDSLE